MKIVRNKMGQDIKHRGQLCEGDIVVYLGIEGIVKRINSDRNEASVEVHDTFRHIYYFYNLVFADKKGWCITDSSGSLLRCQ